jgi:phenylacetate-CoA ligase
MISEAVERTLREFEKRTRSPAAIQKAARLLDKLVGRGFDADLIDGIQRLRLPHAVAYIAQHSPFYRDLFDRLGMDPSEIQIPEDLRKLPFTTEDEVQRWQQFLCVPHEEVGAVFATAGTTGEPKLVPYTLREMQMLTNLSAVAIRVAYPGPLIALIALPMRHGLWMGWATAQRIVERAGGLPLPVGAGDPQETLQWMRRLEPNVLMSSPSYLTVLTRQAQARGYRPKLDKILVGGEMLYDAQRDRFVEYWDAQVFDSYGATEIGGGQTIVLPECDGAFHLNDLHLITEIVHPETGEPAEEGELVFTTLTREAMPLLRYRSGDRARWTECDCWLPARAIRLQGRVDDMFTAGDMNLYGRVMTKAIGQIPGTSGHLELVLDKVDLTDRLVVRVEGNRVEESEVRQALFDAYPKMRRNTDNGNLILEIETSVDLSDQIKALRITDRRPVQQ